MRAATLSWGLPVTTCYLDSVATTPSEADQATTAWMAAPVFATLVGTPDITRFDFLVI
jgi:hypothetical protein